MVLAASTVHALARLRALWLSARPLRAVIETLVIAVAIVIVPLAYIATHSGASWLRVIPTLVLLAGPVCAVWCAVRLRLEAGPWWRGTLREGLIGGAIGMVPTGIIVLTIYVLALQTGNVPHLFRVTINHVPVDLFALIWLAAFSLGFIGLRLILRVLLYWDRLRRHSLRWSLTHAHLMLVLIGAGLLATFALGAIVVLGGRNPLNITYFALTLLIVLAILTSVALVIVLAPSALFSYLFVRPTARRIQALAEATGALRAGDLSMRVPVTGEDEVAQLQVNFNAMAADLQRAMRELQAERDNVATLLRARRELIASVSHELRTPVATLRGYLESTLTHWNGAPPATLQHDLGIMERETIQLQALINDLFTLARVEVGQLEMRPAAVDLAALARRVVEAMGPLAWRARRVEVAAEPGEASPPALADANRVEQILQNLLHNAIRHTAPGGIVAVSLGAPDAYTVCLRVRDTGEGIAPTDLPHIWERFYRAAPRGQPSGSDQSEPSASEPASPDGGGTGLGLALVKELTEAMGGSVRVESAPGEGSCFTICLPRAATTPEDPLANAVAEKARDAR